MGSRSPAAASAIDVGPAPSGAGATPTFPLVAVAGASNLHLGLLPFAHAMDRALGGEGLVLVAAPGAGRSYGKAAGALWLQWPGILESGFASYARERRTDGPRLALLMDIGNDLGYGEKPEVLLGWVAALRTELADAGFRVLIQRPPVESVTRIPALLFETVRRVYFRDIDLTRAELLRRVEAVDRGLQDMVPAGDLLPSIAPFAGPDGIHVVPWNLPAFWDGLARDLVARLGRAPEAIPAGSRAAALYRGLLSRSLKPQRWARFGRWRESRRYEVGLPRGSTLVRL